MMHNTVCMYIDNDTGFTSIIGIIRKLGHIFYLKTKDFGVRLRIYTKINCN